MVKKVAKIGLKIVLLNLFVINGNNLLYLHRNSNGNLCLVSLAF